MTAAERAQAIGWDVTPRQDRNPKGVKLFTLIRSWNVTALHQAAKLREQAAQHEAALVTRAPGL